MPIGRAHRILLGMLELLLLLQMSSGSTYVAESSPLTIEAQAPMTRGSPFDSVPRSVVVWSWKNAWMDRRLTLEPAGISDGPFGDRPHGVGALLTVNLGLR